MLGYPLHMLCFEALHILYSSCGLTRLQSTVSYDLSKRHSECKYAMLSFAHVQRVPLVCE